MRSRSPSITTGGGQLTVAEHCEARRQRQDLRVYIEIYKLVVVRYRKDLKTTELPASIEELNFKC